MIKLCYNTAVEYVQEPFPGKMKYDVVATITYIKLWCENSKHQN